MPEEAAPPVPRIELAGLGDIPPILAISNWAAEHTTANFAHGPERIEDWVATWRATAALHPWLVARDASGAILGFAKSGPHKARASYAWCAEISVYIDSAAHARGIGTRLYERLFALLAAQGYVTLLAGITGGHVASERLHARFGFARCATFHRVGFKHGQWRDVSYWEKHLSGSDVAPSPVRPVAEVL